MIRSFSHALAVAAAAGALFAGPVPRAESQPLEAARFITDGVARVIEIMKAHRQPRETIAARLRAELRRGFDVSRMADLVLGATRRRMDVDQARRFMREFEELIVQTYTSRIITFGPRIPPNLSDIIRVTGTSPVSENEIVVRSRINRTAAQWVNIDWRVRTGGDRLRIVDVSILGISQVQLYRAEFASVLRRSGKGVEGLIDALRRKNDALRSN